MTTIRVTFADGTTAVGPQPLSYELPTTPPAPAGDVWTANYYLGPALQPPVIYSTTYPGPALALDWSSGSPNPAVPSDGFSALFSMTHVFAAGDWQWTANSDDGFQLLVDGVIVPGMDGWIEQSAASKTYTGHLTLTAGAHTVTVRYFEKGGLAALKISAPSPF